MITLLILIGYFGKKWGEQWVSEGLMTEQQMIEIGYVGCFFGKIFGF